MKVGQTHSEPREVWGGCPQGSILGVFLFNATIDDLEEGCSDLQNYDPVSYNTETAPANDEGAVQEAAEQANSATDSSEDDIEDEDEAVSRAAPVSSTPLRKATQQRTADLNDSPVSSTPLRKTTQLLTTDPLPSTPTRRVVLDWPGHSPILSLSGRKKRGKKKVKRLARRLNITEECSLEVPHEPNDRTEAKWRARLMDLLRYIDDGFGLSKINFENSYGFEVNGQACRSKHAIQAQNVFRHVVRAAEDIGMVVNSKKTAMLCVSDSLKYQADAFILDSDQNRIGCQDRIKALGMYFSSRPNMQEQVNAISRKFRTRYWTLRNLKNSGFSTEELVTVYKTIIRPVADYACAVYHPSLTDEQDEALDRLQNHALKCIFGPGLSGRKLREMAGITTLRARREEITEKFAKKLAANPLFAHWFPLKRARSSRRSTVVQETYLEEKARCDRLKNSPLFYYRRILNGKPGRTYGKRYEEYRI